MELKTLWNDIEKTEPPDEKILLVAGPLGIDLAMRMDGHWYFKSGDCWNPKNLEYWCSNQPTKWAEFSCPEAQTLSIQEWRQTAADSQQRKKVLPGKNISQEIAGLSLVTLI